MLAGNDSLALGELFRISGEPGDGQVELEGDLSNVHEIGQGMAGGEIRVSGNAGRHLGSRMSGGVIHVHGDAGDWIGCEMKGGLIHVHGSAGNHAGGAYAGSRRGMTDGSPRDRGSGGQPCRGGDASRACRYRRGLWTIRRVSR